MTPSEIKELFAALPDEERRRCMRELQGDPAYAGFLADRKDADREQDTDTAESPTEYALGGVTLPAPPPSWYNRLYRIGSPFILAATQPGDYADNVEASLTDADICTALYLLAYGAAGLRPYTMARRKGFEAIADALGEIDMAADEWFEGTGATIQDACNLVVLIMSDHPYPDALTEKKTPTT